MEQYFASTSEDNRHERSLILFLGLVEPNILKQVNSQIKKLISLKILLQRICILKEYCFRFVRKTVY